MNPSLSDLVAKWRVRKTTDLRCLGEQGWFDAMGVCADELEAALTQQAQPEVPTREMIERVLKRNLSTPPSGDIAGELLALFAKETAQQAQPLTDLDASRIALAVFDADGPDSLHIVREIIRRYEARRDRMTQQAQPDESKWYTSEEGVRAADETYGKVVYHPQQAQPEECKPNHWGNRETRVCVVHGGKFPPVQDAGFPEPCIDRQQAQPLTATCYSFDLWAAGQGLSSDNDRDPAWHYAKAGWEAALRAALAQQAQPLCAYQDEDFLMILESAAYVYRDLMPHAEPRRVYDPHRAEAEKRLFQFVKDFREAMA